MPFFRHGFGPSILLVLLAACGGEDPAAAPTAAGLAPAPPEFVATVGELAPSDAHVLIRFASADRVQDAVGRLGEAFGQAAPPDPLFAMAGGLGLDVSAVDRTRPWAVALTMSKEAPIPAQTFVLPYADPAAAAAAHPGGTRVGDGYAALSTRREPAPGGLSLAEGLLAGDVSVRVDLEALVALYEEEIEQGLGMADSMMQRGFEGADTPTVFAEAMQGYLDWYLTAARELVDSAGTLDLAVARADDGTLSLDAVFTARKGSPLDASGAPTGDLRALGRHVPADMPVCLLLRFDWSGYMETMRGFFDAWIGMVPEKNRASFRDYLARATAMLEGLGDEAAMGFDLSADGLRMVMAMRAVDAQAYVDNYVALLGEPALREMGMIFEDAGTREIAGAQARQVRMRFDAARYLQSLGMEDGPGMPSGAELDRMLDAMGGGDGWTFDMIAREGLVVFALDATGELAEAALTGAPATDRPELARAAGDLRFAMRVDVRRIARGLASMARAAGEEAPGIPDGPGLPIVIAVAHDGPAYHCGLSVNVEEIARFAQAVEESGRR